MSKYLRGTIAGCLFVSLLIGLVVFHSSTSQAYSPKKKHQATGPFVPGRVLVQFHPETLSLRRIDVIAEEGANDTGEIAGTGVHIVDLPAGADEEAFVKAFQSRSEVEFAELDRIVAPEDITPNDPYNASEWHLLKIAAPTAWSSTVGSSTVTIAVCDGGVDGTHPDLASKMVPGWNFYDNNSNTSAVNEHGTAVAGVAAASSNNGMGVASVAWGCNIMPLRVSDTTGYATYSAIASAITWAADHGARVANVSYVVAGSSAVSSAAQYLQSKGGVLAVSAGNSAAFDSSPDNPYMLVVSATDQNDVLASWSNTGNNVDLSAPGVNILTTGGNQGYVWGSGTSFSAPVVAGVAALMLSVNPALTPAQITSILKQSADDLGPAGWDSSYGSGRVNAARAVSLAAGATPPTPDITPPSVSITSPASGGTVSGTISVQAAASDNVGVASVSFSRDGVLLGSDTTAPYSVGLNTTTLSNGTHTLTATASDAAGNSSTASISVTVSNNSDTTPPMISITSPANGATVSGNETVLVSTQDNVGVVRVELYADGQVQATSTSAPFTTKWNTKRAARGAHILQCKAYDAVGNVGASATITVYK